MTARGAVTSETTSRDAAPTARRFANMLAMRLSAAFGQATAPRAAGLRSAVVRATRTPRLTTPENGVQELSARAGAPAFREPPGSASRGPRRGAGIWLTVAACSVIRHCGPSARPITSSSRTSRTRCVAAVCFSHEKKAAPNCRNDCEWRVPLCPLSACAIGCRGGQAAVGCDRGGEGVDLRGGGRVQ
jgi:hypothetical protein